MKKIKFYISSILFTIFCTAFFVSCSELIDVLGKAEEAEAVLEDAFFDDEDTSDSGGSDDVTNVTTTIPDYNIDIGDNQIQLRDSNTGNPISNMPITITDSNGNIVYTGYTNDNGLITIENLADPFVNLSDGDYRINVNYSDSSNLNVDNTSLSDYVSFNDTITIKDGKIVEGFSISVPKKTIINTTDQTQRIIKVILDWGTTPKDLDLHTEFGTDGHVFWAAKKSTYVNLDRDDVDSYGPETITITTSTSDTQEYNVYVYNYSDRENSESNRLASSNARVKVFINNELVKTYVVPSTQQGLVWKICKIYKGQISTGTITQLKAQLASETTK